MSTTPTTRLLEALADSNELAAEQILLQSPEAATGVGSKGESPLLVAVYHGKVALASRIAAMRDTDLTEAAAQGDVARLTALLDYGADLGAKSYDGWTALHLAAFMGQADAARMLIDRGAILDALSDNSSANTPLCAALAGRGNADVVAMLIDAGADVNVIAAHGVRPLHLAASRGSDRCVRLLRANGAQSDVKMHDGTTPAAMARTRGHKATAVLLDH